MTKTDNFSIIDAIKTLKERNTFEQARVHNTDTALHILPDEDGSDVQTYVYRVVPSSEVQSVVNKLSDHIYEIRQEISPFISKYPTISINGKPFAIDVYYQFVVRNLQLMRRSLMLYDQYWSQKNLGKPVIDSEQIDKLKRNIDNSINSTDHSF